MLPVCSAQVQRKKTAPAALRHGSLMMGAASSAARRGVMPWGGSVISVTTPATSALMRDLTTAPAVTEISLGAPGTSIRVNAGMSVQRGSSALQGNGVSTVLQTVSSARQQNTASTAAQDTSSEMDSVSRWSAVQVRLQTPIKRTVFPVTRAARNVSARIQELKKLFASNVKMVITSWAQTVISPVQIGPTM